MRTTDGWFWKGTEVYVENCPYPQREVQCMPFWVYNLNNKLWTILHIMENQLFILDRVNEEQNTSVAV